LEDRRVSSWVVLMKEVYRLRPPSSAQPMTIHVYPPTQHRPPNQSKRHQVKNACTNCRKVCKKCDDARPCLRCVKYGIADVCVDSERKQRRFTKRGPYKLKKNRVDSDAGKGDRQEPIQTASATASAIQPAHTEPSNISNSYHPFGYPEGFYMYNHYLPMPPQQAESVHVCMPVTQPYFLASVPQFQPYLHPVHVPESHAHVPQAYYTAVFPVSYHSEQSCQ